MNEIIKKLSEPLSHDGIQRTKATETHKGYDTAGYGYQWIVDRFNDVFGLYWTYEYKIIKEMEGEYSTGKRFFDITVNTTIIIEFILDEKTTKIISRSCVGGHSSVTYADALKGAITNSFKKTAAFFGVGADAFRGEIDTDNQPIPIKISQDSSNMIRQNWKFSKDKMHIYHQLKAREKAIYKMEGEEFILYIDKEYCNDDFKKMKELEIELRDGAAK